MLPRSHEPRMPDRLRQVPVDYVSVASYLAALGYPARLELLDLLRFPVTLGQIKLTPHRGEGNPERTAARETIRAHLDKLVEVGLVRVERVEEGGKQLNRYSVNPQKLYGLLEEMRRLSTMFAGRGGAGDATGTLGTQAKSSPVKGPRLVLVHGVYEGKAFPLAASNAQDGRWLIGRRPGLPVCLDYDPYVSLENAVVTQRDSQFQLTDLRGSKNGTTLNWAPLAKDAPRALEPGDVVGVGRSLICFATS